MIHQHSGLSRRNLLRWGSTAAGAAVFPAAFTGSAAAAPGSAGGDGAPAGEAGTSGNTPAATAGGVVTSYNGWPIGTPGSTIGVANFDIPGTTFSLPLRSGDIATVLIYVANRFNREVEPLLRGQLFGYDYRRNVNNPSVWSNHASGTAIDLNADLHPNTVTNSFTAAKVAAVHRILTDCGGVVYWGGDYTRTVDAMHFEVNVAPGDPRLPALAAKITRAAQLGPVVSLRARADLKFVTADNAGRTALIANRPVIGPWEQFDLVDRGTGLVALLSHANRLFVCAEARGAQSLIANRASVGPWETFALIRNTDGTISLRAVVNGRYVTAESAGAAPLIANRTAIGPWERFDLIGA